MLRSGRFVDAYDSLVYPPAPAARRPAAFFFMPAPSAARPGTPPARRGLYHAPAAPPSDGRRPAPAPLFREFPG